jgi:tetratricopeptide (TPR) repeat protein
MKEPRISLCMIVKNEAARLPTCLASVRGVVDEVVVVDTGSTDGTPEVARALGAALHPFAWTGDYAAARNESLRQATGDWILYLDPDERLTPEAGRLLRTLARDETIDAVCLPERIEQAPGDLVPFVRSEYCRLFRNRPAFRFEGRSHEQILPAIQRAGGRVRRAAAWIEHWAYADSPERRARRVANNIGRLEEDLAAAPDDPFVHYNLGLTLWAGGETARAIPHLERAAAAPDLNPALRHEARLRLAQAHLALNLLEAAAAHAAAALADGGGSEAFARYVLATVAFERGRYAEAAAQLVTVRDLAAGDEAALPVRRSLVHLHLGDCRFREGDLAGAASAYLAALAEDPALGEAWYNLAQCERRRGGEAAAALEARAKKILNGPPPLVVRQS